MNMISENVTPQPRSSIGAILVDSGQLSLEAAEQVLRLQKKLGIRFGDAAIRLGLLTEEDIRQALSWQHDYLYLLPDDDHVSEEVVAAFKPFGTTVEQFRVLRSQLMLRWFDAERGHKTLSVVSAERKEGRSFTAANLAVVFSQLRERTLLIDADLRHPRQHELFRLENRQGLSSLLAGRAELPDTISRIEGLAHLAVLPAGPPPPNPQELLSRPEFSDVLLAVQKDFDIIIIDTPAGANNADYQMIAQASGGAVVVARKGMALAARVQGLASSLQYAGVAVVGTVLNSG